MRSKFRKGGSDSPTHPPGRGSRRGLSLKRLENRGSPECPEPQSSEMNYSIALNSQRINKTERLKT